MGIGIQCTNNKGSNIHRTVRNSRFHHGLLPALAQSLVCLWIPAVFAFFSVSHGQTPPGKGGPPPALVEVTAVLEKEVLDRVTLLGTAEPWLETVVAAEEEGLVRKTLVDEGDRVAKGEVLCEQDASQLRLSIRAARAALAEAKVLQAQARREWERQKRLFSIQSVSEKAFEDAQFQAEAAQKKVARLQAELDSLTDKLRKKKTRAPVSGYVVERHCLVGQWLGEGEPVVTLVTLDPIRLMVPVPERYVASLKKGGEASITFDAFPERRFKGSIAAVIPRADPASRTFPVRVEIPNPDGTIKAGMLGRVVLPLGTLHRALLVPKDALVLSGSEAFVIVINGDVAHRISVMRGPAHGGYIEVKGDLKGGQQVVIRGNERLRPGQRVKIVSGKGSEGGL